MCSLLFKQVYHQNACDIIDFRIDPAKLSDHNFAQHEFTAHDIIRKIALREMFLYFLRLLRQLQGCDSLKGLLPRGAQVRDPASSPLMPLALP